MQDWRQLIRANLGLVDKRVAKASLRLPKDVDSGYGVSLPDVTAVADTLDEALREAGIALGLAFEDSAAPTLRSLDELRRDPDFLNWSNDAVVAAVAPASSMADAA